MLQYFLGAKARNSASAFLQRVKVSGQYEVEVVKLPYGRQRMYKIRSEGGGLMAVTPRPPEKTWADGRAAPGVSGDESPGRHGWPVALSGRIVGYKWVRPLYPHHPHQTPYAALRVGQALSRATVMPHGEGPN